MNENMGKRRISLRDWAIALLLVNICLALMVVFLVWLGRAGGDSGSASNSDPTAPLTGQPSESGAQAGTGEGKSGESTATVKNTVTPKASALFPFIERGPDMPPVAYPAPLEETDRGWVEKTLASMTLEQKIGQLMMIGLAGSGKTDANCAVVQQVTPGAVFYQEGGNVNDPLQLRQFSTDLQKCMQPQLDVPILFAMDHEGQYIFRFKEQATMFPTAMAFGAAGDPGLAYQASLAAGQELLYSGVNMVLGPVADVLLVPGNGVLSVRAYGSDPRQVSNFVNQVVMGYKAAGVIPVLKHFPGHGGIIEDSHQTLPVDPVDRDTLDQTYLPPFVKGIESGAQVVMLGHLVFPNIQGRDHTASQLPATLSPVIIDLLRNDMGFQGVVISDAMDMKAIKGYSGTVMQASLDAIRAGVDMVLINRPNQVADVYQYLLNAARSGGLSTERIDQAVGHILQLKASNGMKTMPFRVPDVEPDWAAHRDLDAQVSSRAIAICRDQDDLVPLPQDKKRLMVIGPTPGWSFYEHLQQQLSARGYQADYFLYDLEAGSRTSEQLSYLQTLPGQVANYDMGIIFTWHAFVKQNEEGDRYQADLVNAILRAGKPVLVVALRAPNDLLAFPDVRSLVFTYGHTAGGQQALIDVLLTGFAGAQPVVGKNPLSSLDCDP